MLRVGIGLIFLGVLALLAPVPVRHIIYADTFQTWHPQAYQTCYWWETQAECGGTNREMEAYLPSQISAANGLHLAATADPYLAPSGKTYPYRSGMITTDGHFSFLYGIVEIKARMPLGQGLWPAVWMLPQNRQPDVELDVVENLGSDPHTIYQGVHFAGPNGQRLHDGGSFTGANFAQSTHTFTMEWDPDQIIWSVDGVIIRTCHIPSEIPHTPMFLLADLAVGGQWPGTPDITTHFPADFAISSIVVWQ